MDDRERQREIERRREEKGVEGSSREQRKTETKPFKSPNSEFLWGLLCKTISSPLPWCLGSWPNDLILAVGPIETCLPWDSTKTHVCAKLIAWEVSLHSLWNFWLKSVIENLCNRFSLFPKLKIIVWLGPYLTTFLLKPFEFLLVLSVPPSQDHANVLFSTFILKTLQRSMPILFFFF